MLKVLNNFLFLLDEKILFPIRRRGLVSCLSGYLKDSKEVLDLGSSDGRLANEFLKIYPNIKFLGVDTHVLDKTYIPIMKYDGKNIPYPDNSFDCVMIIDVLHHDLNPEVILREAKRVSRKYVLIKDHYWDTKIDFQVLKFADYIGNAPYGVVLPYNYLKLSSWENLIKDVELKIVERKFFKFSKLEPAKHVVFFLEKNASN